MGRPMSWLWLCSREAPAARPWFLEDQDVSEPGIFAEGDDSVPVGLEHPVEGVQGDTGQGELVVGTFDDDLMGPHAVHLVEHPFAGAVQFPFLGQGREFVVHHPELPAGGIGFGPRVPVGQDLRRRGMFVARIEGAEPPLGDLRFHYKVMGALAPLRRNNHPTADDGIFA